MYPNPTGSHESLIWNCRGLGTSHVVHELTKLVNHFRPHMFFLSETNKTSTEMERIRIRLDFDSCLVVHCVGRHGGLTLLCYA